VVLLEDSLDSLCSPFLPGSLSAEVTLKELLSPLRTVVLPSLKCHHNSSNMSIHLTAPNLRNSVHMEKQHP